MSQADTATVPSRNALSIVAPMYAQQTEAGIFIHLSFGRVIDRLARYHDRIYLSVPIVPAGDNITRDYRLTADNIELIPQPAYTSMLESLRQWPGILRSYLAICRRGAPLFIRGMVPLIGLLYLLCFLFRLKPCHWIVSDPEALLRSHRRASWLQDRLALAVATTDRLSSRWGRFWTGGSFICNGKELGRLYPSPQTEAVVSSTVVKEEFHYREDACDRPELALLFVGFLRPEKGVEYLLEALAQLQLQRNWQLTIVGEFGRFTAYRDRILGLVDKFDLADRIDWKGYLSYGPDMFAELRSADILILPTLSEGTPRVLIEARANGLPVIASAVGGIPSSVSDGVDGLLVPPKDPQAISRAITRLVEDRPLRDRLIKNGYRTAERWTVDRFVEQVATMCDEETEAPCPS
ncbi:MAG: glycosyltransferase [bacterium]